MRQPRSTWTAGPVATCGWSPLICALLLSLSGCTGGELGPGGLVTTADTGSGDGEAPGETVEDVAGDTDAQEGETNGEGDEISPPEEVDTENAEVDGDDVGPEIEDDGDTAGDDAEVEEGPKHLCNTDGDCVDEDACTESTCEMLEGGFRDCVQGTIDCEMGDPCLVPSCDPQAGCTYEVATSQGCCFGVMLKSFDFEGEDTEVTITNLATEGFPETTWSVTEQRSYTGDRAIYFGIPNQLSYDNGSLVAAEVILPSVILPAGARSELNFHVWADVEAGDSWDVLIVGLEGNEQSLPVWVKNYDNVEMGTWQHITVDLAAFTGETVQITFTFNSVDHTFNDTEGIYIDDVWLWTGCGTLSCQDDEACSDNIACTSEGCFGGSCAYATGDACCVVDADCFDGDNCTVDYCLNFACENQPVANPECCNADSECEDGNSCTVDACTAGTEYLCTHPVSTDEGCCETAAQCDDGDPCTIDKCSDFQCDHVNTCCFSDLECDDGDDTCTVDSCVEGACLYEIQDIEGCCDPEPLYEDFEGTGATGWSYDGGGGGCMWQIWGGGQSKSPGTALYYGNTSLGTFNCGETSGNAVLGPINLQPGVGLAFETQIWMDTEAGSFYDKLELHIKTPTGAGTLWTKGFITTQSWFKVSADLSAFAGQTIYLEWYFNTGDDFINDGQGVFIDDMKITSTCQAVACQVDSDCNDGLSFTGDSCEGAYCTWTTP